MQVVIILCLLVFLKPREGKMGFSHFFSVLQQQLRSKKTNNEKQHLPDFFGSSSFVDVYSHSSGDIG